VSAPARVLIVDDDRGTREGLAALLAAEPYEIQLAGSGPECLELARARCPDVILLDVMMPGMDGFEVCRTLRAETGLAHVPIVMLTAMHEKEYLARSLESGADEFLHKPIGGVELRARVRSMLRIKRQHDRLQRLVELREDLTRMIVHDMRSPLMVIQGHASLLAEAPLSADDRDSVARIRGASDKLVRFTNEMLLVAKMEEGRLALNRSTVDARGLVGDAVELHRESARVRRLSLAAALPAAAVAVSVDRDLVARVLDNLLANAVKFSPPDTSIHVELEPDCARIVFRVADEGPGIALEHREAVFDKFATVELKTRGVQQVGLGLAFCKMAVQAHGGVVRVEANSPCGAIFIVELPA
jgi:signal transduction histidine kinase